MAHMAAYDIRGIALYLTECLFFGSLVSQNCNTQWKSNYILSPVLAQVSLKIKLYHCINGVWLKFILCHLSPPWLPPTFQPPMYPTHIPTSHVSHPHPSPLSPTHISAPHVSQPPCFLPTSQPPHVSHPPVMYHPSLLWQPCALQKDDTEQQTLVIYVHSSHPLHHCKQIQTHSFQNNHQHTIHW